MQENTYPRVGNAVRLTILFSVIMLAIGVVLGAIIGFLSVVVEIPEAIAVTATNIGSSIAIIAAFLLVSRRFARKSLLRPRAFVRRHAVSLRTAVGFLALTAGMIILASEIHNLVTAAVPQPEWFTSIMGQLINQPLVLALISVAVLPAVVEEFLFRGYFTLGLRRNASRTATLAASSLLFGLVHLNPWQFFPAAFIGLVLGWLALRSGSILLPMAAHFLNNGLSLLLTKNESLLPIPGFNPAYDAPAVFQPLGFTLAGVALLAAGYMLLQRGLPPTPELPQPAE